MDEAVTIEVFGPDGYHLFVCGALADASGTFEMEIEPSSHSSEGSPFKPGLHSAMALGSEEGGANAPLMITAAVPEDTPKP